MSDQSLIPDYAKQKIEREAGETLAGWTGPTLLSDGPNNYKLTWVPPDDDEEDEAFLTIFGTGEWDLLIGGRQHDGKMMAIHDRRWIKHLADRGCNRELAASSWMYFKSLSETGKPM